MPQCVAFRCTNKSGKSTGVTFHRFPKEMEKRKQWVRAMRRIGFEPGMNTRLCGQHFEEHCFVATQTPGRKRLKDDAIPTIFDFPKHLLKKRSSPRKPPKERAPLPPKPAQIQKEEKQKSLELAEALARAARAKIDKDHSYQLASSCVLKKRLDIAVDVIERLKKDLKTTQHRNLRMRTKMESLNAIIDDFKSQDSVKDKAEKKIAVLRKRLKTAQSQKWTITKRANRLKRRVDKLKAKYSVGVSGGAKNINKTSKEIPEDCSESEEEVTYAMEVPEDCSETEEEVTYAIEVPEDYTETGEEVTYAIEVPEDYTETGEEVTYAIEVPENDTEMNNTLIKICGQYSEKEPEINSEVVEIPDNYTKMDNTVIQVYENVSDEEPEMDDTVIKVCENVSDEEPEMDNTVIKVFVNDSDEEPEINNALEENP